MNNFMAKIIVLLRRLFSPSPEAARMKEQERYSAERQMLADRREDLAREAVRIEEAIRRRVALSQTLEGTARVAVHEDLNRAARELRNVREALLDNNNRLALADEAIRKLELLRTGAGDVGTAVALERLGVEIECLRDGAQVVRDRYADIVRQKPVPDFAEAAGLNEAAASGERMASLPVLDPLVAELAKNLARPASAPASAVPEA